ncbi:hypothetical protein [Eubacterium sp. An3]|uniref:hypothetical protein n=1 Tax=Eubacterium sp. An3 TaxID=1965628 RepID=UPI00194F4B6D|nr:hypothetical protein [Eubacterium sp. An3]
MEELRKLLSKAEDLGWSYGIYEEDAKHSYVRLRKCSPAGEDFHMDIDIGKEIPVTDFMDNLSNYHFDPDEHAEEKIKVRGKNGVPDSIRTLIEDAESIGKMINELYDACWYVYNGTPEPKPFSEGLHVYRFKCKGDRGIILAESMDHASKILFQRYPECWIADVSYLCGIKSSGLYVCK